MEEKELTSKQKEYLRKQRYHKKAMQRYSLMFHKVSDADVIEALETSTNKTDLIRKAIREYLITNKNGI